MQAEGEEYNEEVRGESEGGSYRENAKADPESSMLDYVEDEEEEDDGAEEGEEEEEFQKIRREHVFAEIDFTKRKSKIICTLGPATSETEDIVKLFDAGMSCARINLSHGNAKVSMPRGHRVD